jgi:hypothetical protein
MTRCVCALAAVLLATSPLLAVGETLLSTSTLVENSNSSTYTFDAPAAGTLDISLVNVAWPDRLASLTSSVFTATSVLGSLELGASSNSGDLEFTISGPEAISAFVTARAQGALNLGLYSLDVTFLPAVVPVPLPAGGLLLLAGLLGVALGFGRQSPPRNESVMSAR